MTGLLLVAFAIVPGGAAGYLYGTMHDPSRVVADGSGGDREASGADMPSGARPGWNSRALLASGVVAVAASSAAATYGLAVEGQVSAMRQASLLISCLLLTIVIWLRRRR